MLKYMRMYMNGDVINTILNILYENGSNNNTTYL